MRRRHRIMALAGVVTAPSVLLASVPGRWFDENATGLNRNMKPIDLAHAAHAGVVVTAATVLVVSMAVLVSPHGRRLARPADRAIAAPLPAAGLYIAFFYRVSTAAVTGANIGAGLLFLLGIVLVPMLVVAAIVNATRGR